MPVESHRRVAAKDERFERRPILRPFAREESSARPVRKLTVTRRDRWKILQIAV